VTGDSDQSQLQQRIQELEKRRVALNSKLMDAQSIAEANEIERELWALRTAISCHKSESRPDCKQLAP
jgi:predicted  nucleic acid-binding Zn-ribbon protein